MNPINTYPLIRAAHNHPWIIALTVITFICALILPGLDAARAAGKEPGNIALKYDIYAQGLKMMTLRLDIEVNGKEYLAKSDLKTIGLAKMFASLSARYQATGTFEKTKIRPGHFKMTVKKRKRKLAASFSWTRGQGYQMTQEPPLNKRKKADVAKHLKPGLPDPLSIMLSLVFRSGKNPCEMSRRVFNGRKIFEFKFSYLRQVDVTAKDHELYQGKAYRCEVKDRPIAGYSKKKMARFISSPSKPYALWLVPVWEKSLSHRRLLIPLFVRGNAGFAKITMRLTQASINGRSLKAISLASK